MPFEFVARNGIIARADSQVSGSTRITGSVIVTGSVMSSQFGFTGSLLGTASYVSGSVFTSANPVLSASYALTASFALNAGAGTVGGSGTANRVTKFTAGTTIGDSNIIDDGTNIQITGSNITISGSSTNLIVSGSVRSSGGFTGSLFGTASWASNVISAQTASFINNGSLNQNLQITGSLILSSSAAVELFVIGASQFTGSVSSTGGFTGSILATNGVVSSSAFSSQAQGTLTASINGVAQNIDLGLQTTDNVTFAQVTGSDALFTGTVTVQTLIAQTVTSSVSFVTGSTKFGSQSSNTHQFTGSVSITGSLTVTGPATINNLTGSLFGTASWATNSTSATQVSSNLTQGTGVTNFTYNGSSAQTVAVSGASNLTANTHTKWTGTAFANGNITDDGVVVSVSASNFIVTASNVTIGSASLNTIVRITGSINSQGGFTGSLLGTASWATNATNATQLANNLTQGTGVTTFTYNGSSAQTVAVSGASNLTTNTHTKWTGAAFANGNITDDGIVVSVSASNFIVTSSNITLGSASLNSAIRISGSVNSQGGFTGSLFGTSSWAVQSQTASRVSFNGQSPGGTTFAVPIVNTSGVGFGANVFQLLYLQNNLTYDDSTKILTATSSWASNSLTASFLNPLSQPNVLITSSVILTGSLIISGTSAGLLVGGNVTASTEAALVVGIPPSGVAGGEGGQIILQAPNSGGFNSASMIDNYQNKFRVLSGLNVQSNAERMSVNMTTGQITLNNYTGSGVFAGSAQGYLAFDSSGNIITTTGTGGSTTPGGSNTQIQYNNNNAFGGVSTLTFDGTTLRGTGSFSGSFTGNLTGTASFAPYITGSGTANRHAKFTAGNTIGDSLISDDGSTVTVSGSSLVVTASAITLGSASLNTVVRITGSVLSTGGFTGSLFGTASWATNATTATQVSNNLTQGTGVTSFTYNGSSAQTVAVSGASNLTANTHTKWTGTAFSNGNITDDGIVVSISASNFIVTASNVTIGSSSLNTLLRVTGSVNSQGGFTGSLLGTSSWATNATTATQVGSNLTQGTGVTAFTYNGSSVQTVAVSGASNLTANTHTKWTGTAFANGNITDDGIVVSVSASNFIVTASNVTIGSASLNTILRVTGSVNSQGGFTGSLFGTASWALNVVGGSGIGGSGNTNRVAKFTAGTTIGDSRILDDGTNVQITGSTTFLTSVAAASTPSTTLTLNNNQDAGHRILFSNSATSTLAAIDGDISGSGAGTNDGVLKFWTATDGSMTEKMRITKEGNVGIGNTSSLHKLQITQAVDANYPTLGTGKGALFIAGDTNLYGLYTGINTTDGNAWFQAMRNNSATAYNIILQSAGGNVGINETAPSGKLEVYDNTTFSTIDTFPQLSIKSATGTTGNRLNLGVDQASGLSFIQSVNRGTGATPLILQRYAGDVGIGTTGPVTKLDVRSGVITAGSDSSTNGTEIIRGYYVAGALTVIGSERSNGGPVIGYAVKPSTSAADAFLSSTSINVPRGAYTIAGADHKWYTGSIQTVAENSPVTMGRAMTLTGTGFLGIGTDAPASRLDVNGTISLSGALFARNAGNYNQIYTSGSTNIGLYLGGTGDPGNYYDNTSHYFRNIGGGTTFAFLNSTGLSIGKVSPNATLDVNGNAIITGSLRATAGFTGSLFGTASYVSGSVFTSANPALSASYALTASYALNSAGGGLKTKSGVVAAGTFTSANPRLATVTFSTAFSDNNYSVNVTGEDSRAWSIESKVAGGFVINSNSGDALTGNTFWIAVANGES